MGSLVNHHITTVILVIIAVFIVGLNFYLLYATMFGG
jgi:Mn2+/Fe2+ NRAMP family transporter